MKSIFESKTAWGAIVSAILGALALFDVRLSEADTAPVIEAFVLISSFAFTIYGRLSAKVPVQLGSVRGSKINLLIVAIVALGMIGASALQTGCTQIESFRAEHPQASALIETVAQAVIITAINEQAAEHADIADHEVALKQIVNAAFDRSATYAEVAALIAEGVFALYPADSEVRAILSAGFAAALLSPSASDGTPAGDWDRVGCAVLARHLDAAFADVI